MILKEPDLATTALPPEDPRRAAGAAAERTMAFYLRRAFGPERKDVFVLNDLRILRGGEAAQIDHLVLHRHGMMIIESKSVHGEVRVEPDGQCIRVFGRGRQVGMPSPILQAQRQAELLRALLQDHRDSLRDRKILGLVQGGFRGCPIEIRVAISDTGIIRGGERAPEIMKADAITLDIERRVAAHRRGASFLVTAVTLDPSDDGTYRLTDGEMDRVCRFLLARHTPRRTPDPASPPSSAPREDPTSPPPPFICPRCAAGVLSIESGRYGYYFKCRGCDGNTRLDALIDLRVDPASPESPPGRVRKAGRDFFVTCEETGRERLLYRNGE